MSTFGLEKSQRDWYELLLLSFTQELFNMIERPEYAMVTRLQEGTESQIFKSKFTGWDEVNSCRFY